MRKVKVYKIVNTVTDDVFVGSTTQPLYKRLYNHKVEASSDKASPMYDLMRTIGKDKFRIELLEEFPHSSPEHTRYIEKKYAHQFGFGPSGSDEKETLEKIKDEIASLAKQLLDIQNLLVT